MKKLTEQRVKITLPDPALDGQKALSSFSTNASKLLKLHSTQTFRVQKNDLELTDLHWPTTPRLPGCLRSRQCELDSQSSCSEHFSDCLWQMQHDTTSMQPGTWPTIYSIMKIRKIHQNRPVYVLKPVLDHTAFTHFVSVQPSEHFFFCPFWWLCNSAKVWCTKKAIANNNTNNRKGSPSTKSTVLACSWHSSKSPAASSHDDKCYALPVPSV